MLENFTLLTAMWGVPNGTRGTQHSVKRLAYLSPKGGESLCLLL